MSAELQRVLDAVKREQPRPLPTRDPIEVARRKLARADAVVAAGRAAIAGIQA
jgi:hypothetical protein